MPSDFFILAIAAIVVSFSVSAYLAAVGRQQRIRIEELKDRVKSMGAELKDTQTRLLQKHGIRPLGQEPQDRKPAAGGTSAPRFMTKSQLQARVDVDTGRDMETAPSAHPVQKRRPAYKKVGQQTIDEAKSIIASAPHRQ